LKKAPGLPNLESPMALRLIIEDFEGSTTIVPLEQDPVTIGRKEGNTIQLTEKNVSRSHAKLDHADDGWTVEDLGSYNGVTVNGVVINERVSLREGDIITIGDYSLVLHDDIGKKTVDLDRPLRAANQGQTEGDAGPVLASSSHDLPRLSPSEIEALSTDTLAPMSAVDDQEIGSSGNRGVVIVVVIALLAVAGIGGYMLFGPPAQSGEAANESADGGEAAVPAADDGAVEATPPIDPAAGVTDTGTEEAVAPADTGGDDADATDEGEEAVVADPEPEPEPEETVEDEPTDGGDTGGAPTKKRAKKKAVTPEEAEALLADARKASMAGQLDKAYKLAKQSYSGKRSADALKVMAVSACKMGSATKAKAAYSKMSGGKDAVQKLCASHGIQL